MNPGADESTTTFAPIPRRIFSCSALRTMLTSPTPSARQILFSICPRFDAAAVCTSAVWFSRRIVSTMPSAVSGLTKHDAPSAAVVPVAQQQDVGGLDRAILRVHRAADHRDRLAQQSLRLRRRPRLHDNAGAFIADRHRLIHPRRHHAHELRRDRRRDRGVLALAAHARRLHVGRPDQKPKVGRIDRRTFDAHQDLIGPRLNDGHARERQLQLAVFGHR